MPLVSNLLKYIVPCLAVTIFWCTFLTGEPGWGDDYAMYIIHAINLADGLPYAAMGFIHSEIHYWSTPIASTPGLPLFFAFIYGIFGLNIAAFKIAQLLMFMLGIIFLYYYLSKYSDKKVALFASGCFLFNPYLVLMTQAIATEFLFIPISLVALIFVDSAISCESNRKAALLMFVGGIFAYLAYSVRSIGIVIPIAVLAYCLAATTNRAWLIVLMWISFSLGYVGQSILFPEVYQKTELCIRCIPSNIIIYLRSMTELFIFDSFPRVISLLLSKILTVLFVLFCIIGILITKIKIIKTGRSPYFLINWVRSLHVFDWYIMATIAVILLLDFYQAPRYLIPVIPFFFYYFVCGLVDVANRVNLSVNYVGAVSFILLFGLFVLNIQTERGTPITSEPTQNVFEFIKNELPADSVTAFVKPRVLNLYTGKKTTLRPHSNATFSESVEYFFAVNTTHVLIPKKGSGLELEAWMVEIDILNIDLPVVMENEYFILALIKPLYSIVMPSVVNGALPLSLIVDEVGSLDH